MNIQVTDYLWLNDTDEKSQYCVWSGERIEGLHLIISNAEKPTRNMGARVYIENAHSLADAIDNHQVEDESSRDSIRDFLVYYGSNTSAYQGANCEICEQKFTENDKIYWIRPTPLHVECADELVTVLREDVWEYCGDIIVSNTVQEGKLG